MKLKATEKLIFTLNQSLKEFDFDKEVELKINSIFRGVFIGKMYQKEFEALRVVYKHEAIKELKYLYQIQILGPGLKYEHLAYVKTNWFQHFQIWLVSRFMRFITKLENVTQIVTVISLLWALRANNESNVNVYITNPSQDAIATDTLSTNTKDTSAVKNITNFTKDIIPAKTK